MAKSWSRPESTSVIVSLICKLESLKPVFSLVERLDTCYLLNSACDIVDTSRFLACSGSNPAAVTEMDDLDQKTAYYI